MRGHKINRILTKTGDESPTFYIPELDEHYHSVHGAVRESEVIFIENLIKRLAKPKMKVFETGFGTGLNAFLSFREAELMKKKISYHSIELYPIERNEWISCSMHFPYNNNDSQVYLRMHEAPWDNEQEISRFFSLKKINADLITYKTSEKYDAIIFDAFGPDVQPELWTRDIFAKIFLMMKPGALLSTYSSKGEVRRNLEHAGLKVQRVPGPPGKRQIILASKAFR